ncbi:MAG: YfiR family protein [Myxococcota bacterium]
MVAVLLLASAALAVETADVPADLRAGLILKILAYDRNLPKRAGANVTVAVLVRPGNLSDASCARLQQALQDASLKSTVGGRTVRALRVDYQGTSQLSGALDNVAALYVCPGLSEQVGVISEMSRRQHVLTLSGSEALVRAGLAVGVVAREGRPRVIINLKQARAEGADLDAALLRFSEVIP